MSPDNGISSLRNRPIPLYRSPALPSRSITQVAPNEASQDISVPDTSVEDRASNEAQLIEALRRGDETAFARLIDTYSGALLRVAMAYVPTRDVAEEVVQETWLGVLEGLDRFEARSSLKTWIFKILTNRAKTRGTRESRYEAVGLQTESASGADEPAVDPARFRQQGLFKHHWAIMPTAWEETTPERLLLSKESRAYIEQAIAALPPGQRQVITLRDIEGFTAQETCNILGITETNQRVLLHRARSKVRRALEQYLETSSMKSHPFQTTDSQR
ncbi:MAG: sigma-70 family RNA polymerase sigma factor [Nitrospirae bacterium]|nr:MAG: sigma-70 family RNA polymerase sigma factor [Nitrospirota bacterium]